MPKTKVRCSVLPVRSLVSKSEGHVRSVRYFGVRSTSSFFRFCMLPRQVAQFLPTQVTYLFFPGPKVPYRGCYGATMVTLRSGNEAVMLGCEDFSPKLWGSKESISGYRGSPLIHKLTWQGEHLKWVLLAQSLRYTRTEAIAMLIPDSMTECTAKCKYTLIIPLF